jgi:hypothetical protein
MGLAMRRRRRRVEKEIEPDSVEVVVAQSVYSARRLAVGAPESTGRGVVIVDMVTVHEETFLALPRRELVALAKATLAGELDDPRVMRRPVVLTGESASNLSAQLGLVLQQAGL